jgi:hypothetical protein
MRKWSALQNPRTPSKAGRPRLSLRAMNEMLHFKHAFNLSDETLDQGWRENLYWQHFSGLACFELRLPCDANAPAKFRRPLGEEIVEELLAQTVNLAASLELIAASVLDTVLVDCTLQQKAVAHPTDSKLLEAARAKLVLGRLVREIERKDCVLSTAVREALNAKAFMGNPFDGYTLRNQLDQATILMHDTAHKPRTAYVDLGDRGMDTENPGVAFKPRSK